MTDNFVDILHSSDLFVIEETSVTEDSSSEGLVSFPPKFYEYFEVEAA